MELAILESAKLVFTPEFLDRLRSEEVEVELEKARWFRAAGQMPAEWTDEQKETCMATFGQSEEREATATILASALSLLIALKRIEFESEPTPTAEAKGDTVELK